MQEQFWEYEIIHVSDPSTSPDGRIRESGLRAKITSELDKQGLDRWECYHIEIKQQDYVRQGYEAAKCYLKRQITYDERMSRMRRLGLA